GTDVFGLGVLLYRATTAKEPFAAPSPLGMSIRLSMGNADPIDQHGARVPKPMAALIMRMLAAKPDKRPSMSEVITELSAIVPKDGAWREEVRRLVTAAGGQPAPEGRTTMVEPAPTAPRPSAAPP